jgi:hypothetical protein
MSALAELRQIATDVGNPSVRDWNVQGKKMIAFFYSHEPEGTAETVIY